MLEAESTERILEPATAALRERLEATHRAREAALPLARQTIQFASRAIRAAHRDERTAAEALTAEAKGCVEAIKAALADYPDLYHAGYVHDSQKEYAEAAVLLAITAGQAIPGWRELDVEPAAYLNGLAEAASEGRRHALDKLRLGEMARAETVLKIMDDIYSELTTFDFPDAITGGLRRATDALRAVLERTRSDVTLTLSQNRLESALREAAQNKFAENGE